jgi:hypothetical protein
MHKNAAIHRYYAVLPASSRARFLLVKGYVTYEVFADILYFSLPNLTLMFNNPCEDQQAYVRRNPALPSLPENSPFSTTLNYHRVRISNTAVGSGLSGLLPHSPIAIRLHPDHSRGGKCRNFVLSAYAVGSS